MDIRSNVRVFVLSFAMCPFAFGGEKREAPADGGRFPDAVERGMQIDALQMQRLHPAPERPTITGSWIQTEPGISPRKRRGALPRRPGWPFETDGEIFSVPCFDERSMYFGACDGVFYCLDKKTGTARWRKEGLGRVDSAPALHDGMVFFAATDDTLYALNCDTGEVRWKAQFHGVGYRNPKLLNKSVYITGEGQLLSVCPTDGKVSRRYAFSGEGRDFAWNSRAIVVAASRDIDKDDAGKGSVVCFAVDSPEPRWTTALGGACLGTLVCDDSRCYLGARDGFFYAIEMTDGRIAWRIDCRNLFPGRESQSKQPQTAPGVEVGPVWADEHVIDTGNHVVFSASHQLITGPSVLVSAEKNTGRLVWTVRHPTKLEGRFLAAEGNIVAMAEDRKMLLVSIADAKSVSFPPLPRILGTGFFSDHPRGEFAGVSLDKGELFIVGADAHVWHLPLESIKGTLNWPVAQPLKTPLPKSGTSLGGAGCEDDKVLDDPEP